MQKELHVPTLQPARVKDGVTPELTAEITADAVSAGLKRRVIILLGDVGVGKSMFIRHLVRVDARSLFDKAISLYVDFGKPI
jgi:putative ribosome biogenesis GTPase RsgA